MLEKVKKKFRRSKIERHVTTTTFDMSDPNFRREVEEAGGLVAWHMHRQTQRINERLTERLAVKEKPAEGEVITTPT